MHSVLMSIARDFAASHDVSLAISFRELALGTAATEAVRIHAVVVDTERRDASLAVLATLDRMRATSDRDLIVAELRRERDRARARDSGAAETTGVRVRSGSPSSSWISRVGLERQSR